MKKHLTLFVALIATLAIYGQKTWNFSESPFVAPWDYETSTVVDGLTIIENGTNSQKTSIRVENLSAGSRIYDTYSFTQFLRINAGGVENFIPQNSGISFPVSGPGTIRFVAIAASSTATISVVLSDGTQQLKAFNVSGTNEQDISDHLFEYEYTGDAGKIYLYTTRARSFNVYLLEATSFDETATSNKQIQANSSNVFYNGSEVINTTGLKLNLYNAMGKLVRTTKSNMQVNDLTKGIYIVRVSESNRSFKIVLK